MISETENIEIKARIGSLIKKKREELGLSQEELANKISKSKMTIWRIEEKGKGITIECLIKFAKVFKVDISYFFTKSENNVSFYEIPILSFIDISHHPNILKYQTIPMNTFDSIEKLADLPGIKPIGTLMISQEFSSQSIEVLKVNDKGMEPYIKNNAYVGIDTDNKNRIPISGHIYCVYLPYEGPVIKYVTKNQEGIVLKSKNTMYNDIEISNEELKTGKSFIMGKVKWVWQDI